MSAGDCKHWVELSPSYMGAHVCALNTDKERDIYSFKCEGCFDKCERVRKDYEPRPKKKVTKTVEAWALVEPGITSIYHGEHYAHLRQKEIGGGIVVKLEGTYEVEE